MSIEDRIQWCIEMAEEIEATLIPPEDPHMWDGPRLVAALWREMAARLSA